MFGGFLLVCLTRTKISEALRRPNKSINHSDFLQHIGIKAILNYGSMWQVLQAYEIRWEEPSKVCSGDYLTATPVDPSEASYLISEGRLLKYMPFITIAVLIISEVALVRCTLRLMKKINMYNNSESMRDKRTSDLESIGSDR